MSPRRPSPRATVAAAAAAATVAAGLVAERYVSARGRRLQAVPDEGLPPLAELPPGARRVTSFDGTELAVYDGRTARQGGRLRGSRAHPVLVFVHGFALDVTSWHYQWRRFGENHRTVLYDQRGHGRSAHAGPEGYTFEALGRDLEVVMQQVVGPSPCVLLAHSMGGAALLSLVRQRPEWFDGSRVRAVVLADTTAVNVVDEGIRGIWPRIEAASRPFVRALATRPGDIRRLRSFAAGAGADVATLATRLTNFGPGAPRAVVDHVVQTALHADSSIWTTLLPAFFSANFSDAAEAIRVPALVVVGREDRLTPVGVSRLLAGRIAGARLDVVDDAGHCAMLERPEAFNEVLDEFLLDVVRRSPKGRT
ncbi:MAG TPA: alpha/beta hydrolase [Actinomycetota bacterium]|nr:alpha/beta hydrolase [Actinomycetota bacterium]